MLNPLLAAKIPLVLALHPELNPKFVQEKLDEIEEKVRFTNLSTLLELFIGTGKFVPGRGFVKDRDAFNVHFRHRIKEKFTQICMSITGPDSISVEQTEDLLNLIGKIFGDDAKLEVPHFMALPLFSALHRLMGNT